MTVILIISIYLALLLGLGLFAGKLFKGTKSDYMLASHSIGPFLLLMSIFGTTMTAFALVGSTGEAYKEGVGIYGQLASSSGIIHSLCFFVLGIKVWSLGKKYGYTTQIQFFRDRLDSDKIGLLLFPILVGLVIPYLLIGVMASGVVINGVTEGAFQNAFANYDYGIPPWLGSLVICAVVLVYVFFGGMRGTAWANTFQTIVFMILGVVTFFIISSKLGGLEAASQAVAKKSPSRLMRSVAQSDQTKYEKSFARWTTVAEFNYATRVTKSVSLKAAQKKESLTQFKPKMPGWQGIAQAVYAKKNGLLDSLTIAQKNDAYLKQDDRKIPDSKPTDWNETLLTHSAMQKYLRVGGADAKGYKIFAKKIGHPKENADPNDPKAGKKWTRKKAKGVYRATQWAPDAPHGMSYWVFLSYFFVPLSVGMFPHLFQHWLTAKSASSFKLAIIAHPVFIMIVWVPCVLVGVWATSATLAGKPIIPPHFPPNAVLAVLVKQMTTPILTGFLTAGILAAVMSSLDSQFLCIGTMFTEDIAVHYGGKDRFTDKQTVILARTFIIAIVIVTYTFSLFEPRRVFTLGVWCFSGFSSLFPLILASLYWRRLTKAGAYACVIAAFSSWIYLFAQSNYAANPNFYIQLGGNSLISFTQPGQHLADTIAVMPVTLMIACSTLAMILVSLVTKPPKEETLNRFFPEK